MTGFLRPLLLAALLAAAAVPAGAADDMARTHPTSIHELSTDQLFEMLKVAPSEAAAKPAEAEILRRLGQSGSDTVDLFMSWAVSAINDEEYGAALDVLDRVVTLEPGYVEGWNKRATVHFAQKEYGKSIADIERVLRIEPRHFGALVGLGLILKEMEENENAISAFKAALDVYPHLEKAREFLEELQKEEAGKSI
ncbi:tetratricopeptide repeat protein [Afifella sp. IM 167]|uniref:tetratricopeptide repeat protein n=1 Tax=Afifella sp. IM 167 TaxID=2033586 RepID=UPI001CCBE0C2|nr:tetratricopeptide repeat protein [Afifella sp. IM 167]MBZ8135342.1 hypothetical protein [Afifella sp. IM 167]